MFRRAVCLLLAAVTALAALTGCSSGNDASTVHFGYIADYNGASLLAIADKQGLWKKQGLTPEIKEFTNGPLQVQALGAGDLDFGYIGPGALWLPASGQASIAAIDTLTYADRVIAQPGITSITQLKGKRVGVPAGTSGEMVLNLALQRAGMSDKDINKIPMDPSTVVSAFSSHQIDAAGIWYPLIGTSIKPKVPGLVELASTRDFPDMAFPTAFVSGKKTDPGLRTKVLKVLQEANDWRQAHREESITEAAALLKRPRPDVAADAANVTTMTTSDLVARTKDGTVNRWLNTLADFFRNAGQLHSKPDATQYYDSGSYLKAAAR